MNGSRNKCSPEPSLCSKTPAKSARRKIPTGPCWPAHPAACSALSPAARSTASSPSSAAPKNVPLSFLFVKPKSSSANPSKSVWVARRFSAAIRARHLLEPINPYVQNSCNNTEKCEHNSEHPESPPVLILTEVPSAKLPTLIAVHV